MSSSDAQRSPVHHATEDSDAEPTGPSGAAASAPGRDAQTGGTSSGGSGAAAGARASGINPQEAVDLKSCPDNAMSVPGNFDRGAAMAGRRPDTEEDAIPPGATGVTGGGPGAGDASSGGAAAGIPGDTARPGEADESNFGGPIDLDDPDAV